MVQLPRLKDVVLLTAIAAAAAAAAAAAPAAAPPSGIQQVEKWEMLLPALALEYITG
jgi:hypothetical protein